MSSSTPTTVVVATLLVVVTVTISILTTLPLDRTLRAVETNSFQKSRFTLSQTADGIMALNSSEFTDHCIPIQNTFVETIIQLHPPKPPPGSGSYQLIGYPGRCSTLEKMEGKTPIFSQAVEGGPLVVNERIPVCSFRLGNHSQNRNVQFFKHTPNGNVPMYGIAVGDKHACHNLCALSPWASKFAQSVGVSENGTDSNNYIQIFSDSECRNELASKVGHGENLIHFTQRNQRSVVKSVIVTYQDNDDYCK